MNTHTRFDSLQSRDSSRHTDNFQDEVAALRAALRKAKELAAEWESRYDELLIENAGIKREVKLLEGMTAF